MAKLLGLDMSQQVGWVLFEHGCPPRFGTWKDGPKIPEPDHKVGYVNGEYGPFGNALFAWLSGMVSVHHPDAIAAEAPLVPNKYGGGPDTSTHTVIFLTGLVWTAETIANRSGARFLRVHHEDAKMALVGRAKNVKKVHMKARCHEKGWLVATEHEADAIGVGLHANEIFWPKARA
jgi:hypothetical protein